MQTSAWLAIKLVADSGSHYKAAEGNWVEKLFHAVVCLLCADRWEQ